MKTPTDRPPILYGAVVLAVLSLAWSAYAITDLMHSGKFGLSVAVAGDIGWITVLWAEYRGVAIAGRTWAAPAAGWLIAAGVTLLLVIHGAEHSHAQAIAGPFVVLVGKIVWAFALAAMKDPAAPTPEMTAELYGVMRDSAHEAGMLHARAQARIARIRAEASVTLAQDEADFEISLERMDKRAELGRRTPLALGPGQSLGFDVAAEEAVQISKPEPEAHVIEPEARQAEPATNEPPAVVISSQVEASEPGAHLAAPEHLPFGFSVRQGAQSAQRAQAVKRVAELLAQDSGLTSGQVAEELDVSAATAKRYLREARQGGSRG